LKSFETEIKESEIDGQEQKSKCYGSEVVRTIGACLNVTFFENIPQLLNF
jgi:hypothetical protein